MKSKSLLFVCAIALAIFSCSDETTVYNEAKSQVEMETDVDALINSIDFDNAGVIDIFEENGKSGKFALKAEDDLAGDYPLTLVAQVDAPKYGATNLAATHIAVDGDYAYVSYSTVLDIYEGAIDIVSVSNPHNPKVTGRLHYLNADINSITVADGFIYIAGSVDSELSVTATENSFVAKIKTSNGRFDLDYGITYGFQKGYVGTDVLTYGNKVMGTSGKEGNLTVYSKENMEIEKQIDFQDLRSIAKKDNNIALLDGSYGVTILDETLQTINTININTDFGSQAKKILTFAGDNILVPESHKGVGIYNFTTGENIKYIPVSVHPDPTADGDNVTNAVSINEDIVMVANGGNGLSLVEEKNGELEVFGIIDVPGSINYVTTKGDYAFAAAGKEGMHIIKLNRPSESLAGECAQLRAYSGSNNLHVDSGDEDKYRGSKRFNNVSVSGSLLLCGSWTARSSTTVMENGIFEMYGTYSLGKNRKRKDLVVEKGGVLKIEGSITIYGNVILKENAKLEFIGEKSAANVFGTVDKHETATVSGEFNDVQDKF